MAKEDLAKLGLGEEDLKKRHEPQGGTARQRAEGGFVAGLRKSTQK